MLLVLLVRARRLSKSSLAKSREAAAIHRALSVAFPRGAARLRGMLCGARMGACLFHSHNPLARACALHPLFRDAGCLHNSWIMCFWCVHAVLLFKAHCDPPSSMLLNARCQLQETMPTPSTMLLMMAWMHVAAQSQHGAALVTH